MELTELPDDLPRPLDDGAADHLAGHPVPSLPLPATTGKLIDLRTRSQGSRLVVFVYPRTGRPDAAELTPDWDSIPGARGCTPEACGFRDLHAEMAALGAQVVGLSTQDAEYQREAAERLHLPYPLLSDAHLDLAQTLGLPTMWAGRTELLRRLTMVVRDGVIEHVWYPVFPPDTHAAHVLAWLRTAPPLR